MAHASYQNDKYHTKRNTNLIKLYKNVIGAPTLFEVAFIAALEVLCFAADFSAYGELFGQVMGDQKGMIAAGAISILFPLMTYLCSAGVASRFRDQKKREKLSVALLVAMLAFMLMSLVIRFPLEAAAASDDGASWAAGAFALCLPTLASVLGAFAAALTLHNPETHAKVGAAKLRAKISVVKAEIATLKGNDPQKLRQHLHTIYRAAYCEVDGLMNCAIADSVNALVARQGLAIHDCLGLLVGSPQGGTAQYDSRPAAFAKHDVPAFARPEDKPELEKPQENVLPIPEQVEAADTAAN